jgi:hypothetical protein
MIFIHQGKHNTMFWWKYQLKKFEFFFSLEFCIRMLWQLCIVKVEMQAKLDWQKWEKKMNLLECLKLEIECHTKWSIACWACLLKKPIPVAIKLSLNLKFYTHIHGFCLVHWSSWKAFSFMYCNVIQKANFW